MMHDPFKGKFSVGGLLCCKMQLDEHFPLCQISISSTVKAHWQLRKGERMSLPKGKTR